MRHLLRRLVTAALATAVALGGLSSVPASAAGSTSTWTGEARNGLWSDPANWDVPPEAGDDIVFPSVVTGRTIMNDVPGGTAYGALRFEAPGYTLGGQPFGATSIALATGSAVIGVPVALHGSAAVGVASGAMLALTGQVSGSAGLDKSGDGTLYLTGGNSYTGVTVVRAGSLTAASSGALGSVGAGNGTRVLSNAVLRTAGTLTLDEDLELAGTGVSARGALQVTQGSVSLRNVFLTGHAAIGTETSSDSVVLVGTVAGSGVGFPSLAFVGPGALRVRGTSTHQGGTIVVNGTMVVDGSVSGPTSVGSGGTLLGDGGNLGDVSAYSGTVSASAGSPAASRASRLALGSSGVTFVAPLNGRNKAANGSGYSYLGVSGPVSLGGARLVSTVGGGYAPVAGDVLRIIDVGTGSPGTFADLPEGGLVRPSGTQVPFRISYVGGDGNDVTLTAVTETSTSLTTSPNPSVQDRTATLTATVTPAVATGTVTFKDGSTTVGTATVENGTAVLGTDSLAAGSHSLTATYSGDGAHQTSTSGSVTHEVLADTTAPDTTIDEGPEEGSVQASRRATLRVSSPDDDVTSFRCRIDGSGPFTCSSPVNIIGLSDGEHTFQMSAVDRRGNEDPTPATRTWTVDTTAPGTAIDSGPSEGSSTNSDAASFELSSPDADTVSFECSLDGATFATCTSPHALDDLADGEHTLEVRAVDAAGNVDATPAKRTWTVDTTAPGTAIDSGPAEGSLTNSDAASFELSSPDADAVSFECSLDGATFATCTSPHALDDLPDGEHTLAVRAVDRAGNADPSPSERTWTVDTVAPDTAITAGPAEGSSGTSRSEVLRFSSPDDDARSFQCTLDDAAYAPCTSPMTLEDLSYGSHTLKVRAVDRAGNVDASPAVRTWTVKPVAPTPPTEPTKPPVPAPTQVSAPSVGKDGKVYQGARPGGLALSGKGVAGAVLTVRDAGKVVARTTVRRDSRWTATTLPLGAGRHVLTATQTIGGRTSAPVDVATVTVERLGVTIHKQRIVTSARRPLVRGRGNAGATITVRSSTGRILGRTTVDRDGTWRLRSKKLALGRQTVRATQRIAGTSTTSRRTLIVVVRKR